MEAWKGRLLGWKGEEKNRSALWVSLEQLLFAFCVLSCLEAFLSEISPWAWSRELDVAVDGVKEWSQPECAWAKGLSLLNGFNLTTGDLLLFDIHDCAKERWAQSRDGQGNGTFCPSLFKRKWMKLKLMRSRKRDEGQGLRQWWWVHWEKTKLSTTPGSCLCIHFQDMPPSFAQVDQSWGVGGPLTWWDHGSSEIMDAWHKISTRATTQPVVVGWCEGQCFPWVQKLAGQLH